MNKGMILVACFVLLCLASTSGFASEGIERKYQEMGGPTGPLGAPVTPEYINPDGMGRRQHYEHGSIYWSPATGAYAILNGPFWEKWAAYGWEQGLGYPVTDAIVNPDGIGRRQHYERGSIYWSPATGAYAILNGPFWKKWAAQGWEQGPLGYPVTDEMLTSDSVGRRQYFQYGQLYQPYWNGQEVLILNFFRSMTTCSYGDPDCSQCVPQIFDQVDALFNGNRDASVGFTMHLDERISLFGGEHVQGVARLPDITIDGHRRGRVVMSFNEGKGMELGYQPVPADREAFRYGSARFDSAFSVGVRTQLNHPGGIQAHGDLLVVAMEQQEAAFPPAQIQFVNFSETSGEIVNVFSLDGSQGEPYQATQSSAASAGFLKLNSGFFLLAVSGANHGTQGIWFYQSSDREINKWTTWNYVDFWKPPCVGYDGECFKGAGGGLPLLAGCDGNTYLLGLTGERGTKGPEYDTIQLYQVRQLDSGRVSLQKLVQHRRSVGLINLGKISFRWAGGAFVSHRGLLSVTATERRESDFSGSLITATTFYPKCRPELPVACD